jgi:hypothetical protein
VAGDLAYPSRHAGRVNHSKLLPAPRWVCGNHFQTRWHHAAHYATLCSDPCRLAWRERKKKGILPRHPNVTANAG